MKRNLRYISIILLLGLATVSIRVWLMKFGTGMFFLSSLSDVVIYLYGFCTGVVACKWGKF